MLAIDGFDEDICSGKIGITKVPSRSTDAVEPSLIS
jgi:hypothetical protein